VKKIRSNAIVFRRISMTFDLKTVQKCRELANEKGQSVSSLVRYLIREAHEKATAAKSCEPSR
jgi:hypothetical protein